MDDEARTPSGLDPANRQGTARSASVGSSLASPPSWSGGRREAMTGQPTQRSISAPTTAGYWLPARCAKDFRVIDAFSRIIRLGEGMAASGRLGDAGDRPRYRGARRSAVTRCATAAVTRARLIATEACRAAENGVEFRDRVKARSRPRPRNRRPRDRGQAGRHGLHAADGPASRGCHPVRHRRRLVGDRAARAQPSARAAARPSPRDRRLGLAARRCRVARGALRRREGRRARSTTRWSTEVEAARAPLRRRAGRRLDLAKTHLLGTSGTVTTIAGLYLQLAALRPPPGRRLLDARHAGARPCSMSCARHELRGARRKPCIGAERADLVLAGCAILDAIRRVFPCERLRVADRGLREGMLVELMRADDVWREAGTRAVTMARDESRPLAASRLKDRQEAQPLSPKRWLERQLNDPYVARARRGAMRSRAAFKLIEIDDKYRIAESRAAGWSILARRPAAGARSPPSARARRTGRARWSRSTCWR